jgi:tRNA pseudouridine55 synthase
MQRRKLDGVLLLDKPVGLSSNAALLAVKRQLRAEKAGHAGTLDPLASGLLPLLFGEATKFARFGLDAPKEYVAQVRLGVSTETGDAEGAVTARHAVEVDDTRLGEALNRFRGEILQVPPMYSALKHEGQPLYKLARAGQEIERAPRPVTVHELELLGWEGDVVSLRIRCSKGTYVRQIAADLGSALGTGAHLAGLRRVAVGAYRLDRAVTLEDLQAMGEEGQRAWLLPVESLIEDLPRVQLQDAQVERFLSGQGVEADAPDGPCRVYGRSSTFLGLGKAVPGGRLQALRLLARG